MKNTFTTYKGKYHLGDMPGDQCVSWWTQKDYDRHAAYVEELKASGDYGKEEEVYITLRDDAKLDSPLKEKHHTNTRL